MNLVILLLIFIHMDIVYLINQVYETTSPRRRHRRYKRR